MMRCYVHGERSKMASPIQRRSLSRDGLLRMLQISVGCVSDSCEKR